MEISRWSGERSERKPPDQSCENLRPGWGGGNPIRQFSGAPSGAHSQRRMIRGCRSFHSLYPRLISVVPPGQVQAALTGTVFQKHDTL